MDEYLIVRSVAGVTATITVEAKTSEAARRKLNTFLKGLRDGVEEVGEYEPERV